MFSFFKKKSSNRQVNLSALHTDMHSHLVPGIDDGAKELEDSMQLITGLVDLGYQKLITTPHIMSDLYPNTRETIETGLSRVKTELKKNNLSVKISAAAEYYFDDHVDRLLQQGSPLLTLSENMVLVEFSFVSMPLKLNEKFFDLQIKGYQPVLAHPERYLYFARNKGQFDEFKSMGCHFQVNLLSFTGYYGKAAQDIANYLVEKGYIDLLGTDMHHLRHLDTLRSSGMLMDIVERLLDSGKLLNPQL